ncbi:hypothetical protein AGMMS49960_19600 [Betaproteobacteria bacterium]|nr:hypothetical protein AGMMS49543_08840 [Betaproteobacteria bacterium]GHU04199.1 hypothetical protein AGMMS49960_19600 [Betaproteobacteria bacterium]GHU12972.1 hypothetical protein AGMMS50225_22060 [Betaproteobacteria bacterium]GHU18343.1 hypothetical protein AGMMS50243_08190 [Betaproteobacteria bacterium]
MPAKKKIPVSVARLTVGGKYQYPWHSIERGEAEFTPSFATCYFGGHKFTRVRGGTSHGGNYGGNYVGEDGDFYRITQHKDW